MTDFFLSSLALLAEHILHIKKLCDYSSIDLDL